ncbi:hypothetical protein NW739_05290 [Mycoplasmopsis felis]|nr:hypothetical protein [Mycoplasmopsis felis]MCU9940089.1 hypothetical protein [Mycoplasmopsis felis]
MLVTKPLTNCLFNCTVWEGLKSSATITTSSLILNKLGSAIPFNAYNIF